MTPDPVPPESVAPASPGRAPRSVRRIDLDRLRVFACLTTFAYHAIQVFDLNPYYHLKSLTPSPALDIAARLLHAVRMPLFFLLAGMVTGLTLSRLTNREFMWRRAVRLLPPFIVGVVLFAPGIKYFELLDGRFISWRGFVAWDGVVPEPAVFLRRFFTQQRWFSWSHMWFPVYLFVLGGLALPVLRKIDRTDWSTRLPPTMLLALPLAMLIAVELVLRPVFPFHIPNLVWDWASVCVYVTVFVSGAALVRWPVLEATLQRRLWLMLALMGIGIWLYVGVADGVYRPVGRALTLWGTLCVAIGLRPLLSRGRIIGERYLSEATLPLYVLHHLPLIVIAFVVKDMPWPVWQRYGVIVLASLGVTLALYHVMVRPFDGVRWLFGMPARRGETRARPALTTV